MHRPYLGWMWQRGGAGRFRPTGFWYSDLILSPDEEWVYFASTLDGGNSVFRAKIDGSGMQRLYGLEDDDRAVSLELMPDAAWLVVSYMEDNFPIQRLHRVRISVEDGHVERLPDGSTPLASGLIDLGLKSWLLMVVGLVLMVVAGGLPLIFNRVRGTRYM